MISKYYTKEQQGEVLGAVSGLRTLSGFLGPLLMGNLFSYYVSPNPWPFQIPGIGYFVAGGVSFVCLIIASILFARVPEPLKPVSARSIHINNDNNLEQEQDEEDDDYYSSADITKQSTSTKYKIVDEKKPLLDGASDKLQ